jgi:hypothetical protein
MTKTDKFFDKMDYVDREYGGYGCFIMAVVAFGLLGWAVVHKATRPVTIRREIRYDNIDRVFMHDRRTVSFFIQGPDSKIDHIHLWAYKEVEYFSDVPEGEKMWATYTELTDDDRIVKVHLHDVKDVGGGAWQARRGKRNIEGQTSVVE